MILRAILAFLALPATVGGLIPWALSTLPAPSAHRSIYGAVPMLLGTAVVMSATVSFYRLGEGTLAPWDPPRRIVVKNLYRFNRNPMYIGVVMVVLGWSVLTGNLWNYLYTAILPVGFHLRIVLYEEREMRRQFGKDWERYRRSVPRWGVRLTPYRTERETVDASRPGRHAAGN
jgi:protein-S-isoprenylcysteine O-methyltransferase Ste14